MDSNPRQYKKCACCLAAGAAGAEGAGARRGGGGFLGTLSRTPPPHMPQVTGYRVRRYGQGTGIFSGVDHQATFPWVDPTPDPETGRITLYGGEVVESTRHTITLATTLMSILTGSKV